MCKQIALGLLCLLVVVGGTCSLRGDVDVWLVVESVERSGSEVTLTIRNDGGARCQGEAVLQAGLSYDDAWIPEWCTVFAEQSLGEATLGPGERVTLRFDVGIGPISPPPEDKITIMKERLETVWTGYTDTDPDSHFVGLVVSIGSARCFTYLPLEVGVGVAFEVSDAVTNLVTDVGDQASVVNGSIRFLYDPYGGALHLVDLRLVGSSVRTAQGETGPISLSLAPGSSARYDVASGVVTAEFEVFVGHEGVPAFPAFPTSTMSGSLSGRFSRPLEGLPAEETVSLDLDVLQLESSVPEVPVGGMWLSNAPIPCGGGLGPFEYKPCSLYREDAPDFSLVDAAYNEWNLFDFQDYTDRAVLLYFWLPWWDDEWADAGWDDCISAFTEDDGQHRFETLRQTFEDDLTVVAITTARRGVYRKWFGSEYDIDCDDTVDRLLSKIEEAEGTDVAGEVWKDLREWNMLCANPAYDYVTRMPYPTCDGLCVAGHYDVSSVPFFFLVDKSGEVCKCGRPEWLDEDDVRECLGL